MNTNKFNETAKALYLPVFRVINHGDAKNDNEHVADIAAYQTCRYLASHEIAHLDGNGRLSKDVIKLAKTIRSRRRADILRKAHAKIHVSAEVCDLDELADEHGDFRDAMEPFDASPSRGLLVKLLLAYGVDVGAFDKTMLRVLEVRFSAEGNITDTETAKRLGISRKAVRKARERIKARDDIQALRGKLCRK